MTASTLTLEELVAMRNTLMVGQKELYIAAVTNINMRNRELLKNDFGMTLVKNCAWDAADIIVNRFFNTADYYISPQQMYERIVRFSYDDHIDPLASNTSIRKMLYENESSYEVLADISEKCRKAQIKLFDKEDYTDKNGKTKKRYVDRSIINKGKDSYSSRLREKNEVLSDEITGVSEGEGFKLERDHVRPVATATYDARIYNTPERIAQLKELFNSDSNFQMLFKQANESKGDVRVYSDGERILTADEVKSIRKEISNEIKSRYIENGMDPKEAGQKASEKAKEIVIEKYDITYKATAKQYANAICERLESAPEKTKESLRKSGFLDENDKVPDEVRKKFEDKYRVINNAESINKLKILTEQKFDPVTDEALEYTQKAIKKIVVGQIIYYVLPPMVFETKTLANKKGMTIDRFFVEIKRSGKRVTQYVVSKMGEMFKNIVGNTVNKFLKSFFDILIEAVKETVRRLLKIIKQVVLSLINCMKIICSNKSSGKEKADAVTKTLAVTISSVALEIIFEWAEEQFGLPDIIMEPLQIIVTILTTNLIMLILQKADLFDVQYGLLVANIERVFEEENRTYLAQSSALLKMQEEKMSTYISELQQQIEEIEISISTLNLYEEDATDSLNRINLMFDMGIDFDKEWLDFVATSCGGI